MNKNYTKPELLIYILLIPVVAYTFLLGSSYLVKLLSLNDTMGSAFCNGLSSFISYALYILVFGYIYVKQTKKSETHTGSPIFLLVFSFCMIILGICFQFFICSVLNFISLHQPQLLESYEKLVDSSFSSQNNILQLLTVMVLAPIGEELAFRGIMQNMAAKLSSPIGAIFITGILFGMYHMNPVQICYAIPMGLILSLVVYISKSISLAIVLHMAINISGYLMPAFLFKSKETTNLSLAVSFILSISLLVIIVKLLKQHVKNK